MTTTKPLPPSDRQGLRWSTLQGPRRSSASGSAVHLAEHKRQILAEVPAYANALRRMWRDTEQYGARPDHPFTATYRNAIEDLAHELGVDLDSDA